MVRRDKSNRPKQNLATHAPLARFWQKSSGGACASHARPNAVKILVAIGEVAQQTNRVGDLNGNGKK